MVYTGSDAGDHASAPQPSGSGSVPASVNVPGLVVAAVWAVGLVAGLVALTIGHLAVAAAALVVAAHRACRRPVDFARPSRPPTRLPTWRVASAGCCD